MLLSYIGGKMLYEGIKNKDCNDEKPAIGFAALIIQGIADAIGEGKISALVYQQKSDKSNGSIFKNLFR